MSGAHGRDHNDISVIIESRPRAGWRFMQTDAAVHSGNFGGPLLDAAGRLVGITVGKFDGGEGGGLAFAAPAERVARVVAQLRRGPVSHQQRPPAAAESHGFTEIAYRGSPHLR
jgi:S1-C subfamily serine protease